MPSSVEAVLVVVVFIMPGFIAGRVWGIVIPYKLSGDADYLLQAISLSCANYALVSWLLAAAWFGHWYENLYALIAVLAISLAVVPVALGIAIPRALLSPSLRRYRERFGIRHPTPKAWDYHFSLGKPVWVLATMKDGKVIAGYFGSNSFASSFPHEEDLFLEKVWLFANNRIDREAPYTAGVIIRMENVSTLQLYERLEPNRETSREVDLI